MSVEEQSCFVRTVGNLTCPTQNIVTPVGNMDESTAKEESTQNEKGQSSGGDAEVIEATSGQMSFAQLKALKEEDRTKHFTKKNGKRLKLETTTLPLTVAADISYD